MASCKTCQLTAERDRGTAPPWDSILRTPSWDLVHSYNSTLEGWLVLVVRRHITSLAEMTATEAAELGPLIQQVSAALHEVTGCAKTYLAQFAEDPDHPHVHLHLVPRQPDHPPEARGPRVFSLVGDDAGQPIDEDTMNRFAARLRAALADLGHPGR